MNYIASDTIAPATLKDGRHIEVLFEVTADFPSAVELRLTKDERVVSVARLPYPRHGLAGGRLILSPSERLVLLATFSGQSEEAYDLFQLAGGMEKIASMSYEVGESASYGFSSSEDLLLMALPDTCCEWWLQWQDAEAEPDERGRLSFRFGQLRVHEIASNVVSVHEIRVSVPEGWAPDDSSYDPELYPRMPDEQRLVLSMPWGDVEVPFPVPTIVLMEVSG